MDGKGWLACRGMLHKQLSTGKAMEARKDKRRPARLQLAVAWLPELPANQPHSEGSDVSQGRRPGPPFLQRTCSAQWRRGPTDPADPGGGDLMLRPNFWSA